MAYYSTHGISQFLLNNENKGYGFYWPALYMYNSSYLLLQIVSCALNDL